MRMKGVVIAVMKPMNVLKTTVTALLCCTEISNLRKMPQTLIVNGFAAV